VHASDDDTIGETVEPLPDILRTAKAKAPGLPLAIGPMTLRWRFNPNATTPEGRAEEGPADPRQGSVLAAAWTLGTVAGFLDEAVSSLAFFEPAGPKGLIGPDGRPTPAAHLLARLAPHCGRPAAALVWDHEPRARGLLIEGERGRGLALAQLRETGARLALPEGAWSGPEELAAEGFTPPSGQAPRSVEVGGFGLVWMQESAPG